MLETEELQESQTTLSAPGYVSPAGRFEVVAMTAGNGNGWEFSEDVLRSSIPLWEGASCFIDHAFWSGHSVKDLAGVFSNARFDGDRRGVLLELVTKGPSGQVVDQLGREMLRDGEPKPNIGFSADIFFTSKGKQVMQITRVQSIDLVISPARGGAFIRALNSLSPSPFGRGQGEGAFGQQPPEGVSKMTDPIKGQETAPPLSDLETMRTLLNVQQEQQRMAQEAEAAKAVRLQMCQYLLDSGIGASKLPAPMAEHVRAQFAGKMFDPAELNAAIESARELVTSLTGAMTVAGPRSSLTGMFSSEDQIQLAVDDLMGVTREKGKENVNVARLSGIRELYLMLTGDDELHGGYYPSRVRLATTADFTGLVKNALNKIVANQWDMLGRAGYDWWTRVTAQESFSSLNGITGTLVGTVGTLPVVAEGAEYTELAVGDSPETADFVKYGGYIPLTLELIDRDETRKLRAYPRELANAGLRRISALVAAIFTQASALGPTMADTGTLFNATAVTSLGGHKNLLTTALSAAEWEVVATAVYNQPMLIKQAAGLYGTGPKQALNPRFCLVPRALQLTAMKILYPMLENNANIYSENLQRGQMGDVVTVPEWTDATDWAAACDPMLAPGIFVGTRFGIMPEVFLAGQELSPAVFMNDEHRLKVRHFIAVWVNDFRPLHKSNV